MCVVWEFQCCRTRDFSLSMMDRPRWWCQQQIIDSIKVSSNLYFKIEFVCDTKPNCLSAVAHELATQKSGVGVWFDFLKNFLFFAIQKLGVSQEIAKTRIKDNRNCFAKSLNPKVCWWWDGCVCEFKCSVQKIWNWKEFLIFFKHCEMKEKFKRHFQCVWWWNGSENWENTL